MTNEKKEGRVKTHCSTSASIVIGRPQVGEEKVGGFLIGTKNMVRLLLVYTTMLF